MEEGEKIMPKIDMTKYGVVKRYWDVDEQTWKEWDEEANVWRKVKR